jgi:hypothetical protein
MDEDGEGVCAGSQHENVLMGMELAAGAEDQASELPIYRQFVRSRGQKSAGRWVVRPGVGRLQCSLSSLPTGVVTCARSLTGRVS